MSDVEMQVCMLLKMRFIPSEIATVIIKDVSSISSIHLSDVSSPWWRNILIYYCPLKNLLLKMTKR